MTGTDVTETPKSPAPSSPRILTALAIGDAALAPAIGVLIVFRALQGTGGAVEGPEGVPAHRAGYGFGADATQAGLFLLPAAAGLTAMGPLRGLLTWRHGARPPFPTGTGLMAIAIVLWVSCGLAVVGAVMATAIARTPPSAGDVSR